MEDILDLEQGDEVWDSKYGYGVVAEYNEAKHYCYDIRFEHYEHPNLQYVSYTREGKDNSLYRTLIKKSEMKSRNLLFTDHYSLKHYRTWEHFKDENDELYMLVNRIVNDNNILIGYEGVIRNGRDIK